MPKEPAKYFDNVIIGQYALSGVPLKVYVDGEYLTIADSDDVEDPLIGYGMKLNGDMVPFQYNHVDHISASGNKVDLETYNKAMEDKFTDNEPEAEDKAGDEPEAEDKGEDEAGAEDKAGEEDKEEGGGEDSGNPFESVIKLSDLINEISKDEYNAEEDALKSKIEAGKAKIKAAKDKLSDLKKQPIEDGVVREGVMSQLHVLASESESFEDFYEKVLTDPGMSDAKLGGSYLGSDIKKFLQQLYQDMKANESLNEFGPLAGSGNTDQLEKIKRDAMRKSEKKSGETVYVVGGKYGSYKISKYYEEDNTYAAFHNGIEMPVNESVNESVKDITKPSIGDSISVSPGGAGTIKKIEGNFVFSSHIVGRNQTVWSPKKGAQKVWWPYQHKININKLRINNGKNMWIVDTKQKPLPFGTNFGEVINEAPIKGKKGVNLTYRQAMSTTDIDKAIEAHIKKTYPDDYNPGVSRFHGGGKVGMLGKQGHGLVPSNIMKIIRFAKLKNDKKLLGLVDQWVTIARDNDIIEMADKKETFTVADIKKHGSLVNKRRAAAELKQKIKGKRADGFGPYTGRIWGIDSAGNAHEITDMDELDLYVDWGLMESVNESMAEPLFPDVLKIKKATAITPNANNPSDTLPAGIYKNTDEEFDTMQIYISKGKKWYLYPEDMDTIKMNETINEAKTIKWKPSKNANVEGFTAKSFPYPTKGDKLIPQAKLISKWTSRIKSWIGVDPDLSKVKDFFPDWTMDFKFMGDDGNEYRLYQSSEGARSMTYVIQKFKSDMSEAFVPTWKQLGYEDWNSYNKDREKAVEAERDEVFKLIKQKGRLGNVELTNLKTDMDNAIEFMIEVPGVPRLQWLVMIETEYPGKTKEKAYIGISSPDHRGVYEKRMSGRNADANGIWKMIEDIWNGKYARRVR